MRTGLLINPRSRANAKGSPGETDGIETIVTLSSMTDLPDALEKLRCSEIDLLAVSGGDGTLQAVLTHLLVARDAEWLPDLAVIPSGTTNMSAGDIGLARSRAGALKALRRVSNGTVSALRAEMRPALMVDGISGTPTQCGMFMGGIGIYRAIQLCRENVHRAGLTAGAASAAVLATALLRGAFGSGGKLFAGEASRVTLDDKEPIERDWCVLMLSTLKRLVLGSRPFWGTGHGEIGFTGISTPVERLLRSTPRLLYGPPDRRLPNSYLGAKASRVKLELQSPFTIDGELFEPSNDGPLTITHSVPLRFVKV